MGLSFVERVLPCCLILEAGCGYSAPDPAAPLTSSAPLCLDSGDTGSNCTSVRRVEGWLGDPHLEIVGAADAPRGIQHTHVLTLRTRDEGQAVVFRAKWRAYATMGSYNDPRKELVAYAVQRLFLEPHEFVVPPTAAYCWELDSYRRLVDAAAEPTFASGGLAWDRRRLNVGLKQSEVAQLKRLSQAPQSRIAQRLNPLL